MICCIIRYIFDISKVTWRLIIQRLYRRSWPSRNGMELNYGQCRGIFLLLYWTVLICDSLKSFEQVHRKITTSSLPLQRLIPHHLVRLSAQIRKETIISTRSIYQRKKLVWVIINMSKSSQSRSPRRVQFATGVTSSSFQQKKAFCNPVNEQYYHRMVEVEKNMCIGANKNIQTKGVSKSYRMTTVTLDSEIALWPLLATVPKPTEIPWESNTINAC